MFEKMIGVSPPHKGEAPNSKLAESKDLRGASKSDYKKDFEKALHKKLDSKKEDAVSKKEAGPKENEIGTDLKEKKAQAKSIVESLGGTKKKVTEDDEKIVSNLMASQESKVETPDLKKKELAEIEIDIPEKAKETESTEQQLMAALMGLTPAQPAAVPLAAPIALEAPTAETVKAALPVVVPLEAPTAETVKAALPVAVPLEAPTAEIAQVAAPLKVSSLNSSLNFKEEINSTRPVVTTKAQTAEVLPEAELSAAVNFVSDPKTEANKELLAKLEAYEGDKNPIVAKAKSFEQSVLSRLQNDQPVAAVALAGQGLSDQAQQGFEQKDSDSFKDAKSDVQNSNPMHLASGPLQNDFKAHIAGAATSELSINKLENNREANINDVMNQAQYLVKKGGGEVTVKMSPEGMGEVHLKVMLQDGKLNIEMQTQDKNVKKLIEESLSDLKSGLAAHRLSLEHVKVDTVNATNADNNMQFQSNLNQGGSERRAQEQWNDFQQNMNNQSGKKSSYNDSTSASNVSENKSNRVAPLASAIRTYGGTKGATVNRVA
jgi:flagellar hook-length control protein FliK